MNIVKDLQMLVILHFRTIKEGRHEKLYNDCIEMLNPRTGKVNSQCLGLLRSFARAAEGVMGVSTVRGQSSVACTRGPRLSYRCVLRPQNAAFLMRTSFARTWTGATT
jgi:hypothetical protein